MASKASLIQAERGRIGPRRRWGPPKPVRLDDLTPAQRQGVLALVEVLKAANELNWTPLGHGVSYARVTLIVVLIALVGR